MSDDGLRSDTQPVPVELQQDVPRKIRLATRGVYYLAGSGVVSAAILAISIFGYVHDSREGKKADKLTQEGEIAYAADARAGGLYSATVYYAFNYKGEVYRGRAYLPSEYRNRVGNCCKSNEFPVLFLPGDPSVNYPYDWRDANSFPWLAVILMLIVVVQWSALSRFIFQDLRLLRHGIVAIGTVTSCRYGRSGGILLKYEFRDMDGLLTEGKGEYPTPKKQDARVCVLYLPKETTKSRPYPLVFFRAVSTHT